MNQKVIKEAPAGAILAIELEINLIENEIEAIESDLEYLYSYRGTLYYNRLFLKKEKVVTSILEFKRTKNELIQVDKKIQELKNLSLKTNRKMELKLKALEYYMDLFEKEEIIESQKVLLFTGKYR